MKCIVVANTAGGVGKTTSAHSIAVASAEYGKKVLLIDADPAGTLTFCCGIENPRVTTLEFLSGSFSLDASTVKSSERFTLMPASSRLASINLDSTIEPKKLVSALSEFDLVIIDTATGPNQILTYFLEIADLIITPTTAEIISVRGVVHIKSFAESSGKSRLIKVLVSGTYEQEPGIQREEVVGFSQVTGRSVLTEYKNSVSAANYREVAYSLLEELSLI
jgi:cellulose biosynthesis protein BcsQ